MRARGSALLLLPLLLVSGCGSDAAQPGAGTLRVVATTSGRDLDPDGYLVNVDGGAARAIGLDDSLDVADLPAGEHVVGFGGLAGNCTLGGEALRRVTVADGATTRLAFAVTCAGGPTGSIAVTTTTTGSLPDPDGYTVALDGGAAQPIGTDATVTLADVEVGPHLVAIGGLAANCQVQGDNPRAVSVAAGAETPAPFAVFCP